MGFYSPTDSSDMSNTKDGINPLRPYHVPQPVLQNPIEPLSNSTVPPNGASPSKSAQTAKHGLGSSARDMLSDLDYSNYLSDASPSVLEMVKSLLDQGLWKYTSVLMAQPFDLAKVVLQVQDAGSVTGEEEEKDRFKNSSRNKSRPYDVWFESICSTWKLTEHSYHLMIRTTILNPILRLQPPVLVPLDIRDVSALHHDLHHLRPLDPDEVLARLILNPIQKHSSPHLP